MQKNQKNRRQLTNSDILWRVCLQKKQNSAKDRSACKDYENANLLENWRPISLLNVDYKIISKVLSHRLVLVFKECIHEDQTSVVTCRSIQDGLHLIQNIVDYCEQKSIKAAINSYNQSKAFRLSFSFVYDANAKTIWFRGRFHKMGTNAIHRCRKKNPKQWTYREEILNTQKRETRMPSVSTSIRSVHRTSCCCDPRFDGLRIPSMTEKIRLSQYADDTNTFVTTERAIEVTLDWFKIYGKSSRAIHIRKTRGLWLDGSKSRKDTPFGFDWRTKQKIYGLCFGHMAEKENSENLISKWRKQSISSPDDASHYTPKKCWPTPSSVHNSDMQVHAL